MKEKIEVVLKILGNAFEGGSVEYQHAEGRHKFALKLPAVAHKLDFTDEVLAGKDAGHIKRLCKQVVAHLQHAPAGKSKHLLMKGDGIHEEF